MKNEEVNQSEEILIPAEDIPLDSEETFLTIELLKEVQSNEEK